MRFIKIPIGLLLFIVSISMSYAQETCQPLLQEMIERAQTSCSEFDENQACYGNRFVTAIPAIPLPGVDFFMPGSTLDIQEIQGYELNPFDAERDDWGIALAHITPQTPEEHTISIVMFGNVHVWDATRTSPVNGEGTILSPTNLLEVGGDFNTGIRPLESGEIAILTAREPLGNFVRVIDDRGNAGWIEIGEVSTTIDVFTLPIIDGVENLDPTGLVPMQAIYVDRILGIPTCVDVPMAGVLIQTVESTEAVNVLMNGVNIELNGTMYVTADIGMEMWIDVLAGQAQLNENMFIKCEGEECYGVTIPAGTRAVLPLSNTIDALLPQLMPYDMELVNKLPIILLDEEIEPVAPLSQEAIDSAQPE